MIGPAAAEAGAAASLDGRRGRAAADAAADGLEPELEHAPKAMTATLARAIHRPVDLIFKAVPPLL